MKDKYIFKKATPNNLTNFYILFSESIKKQFPEYSSNIKNFFLKKRYNINILKKHIKKRKKIIYLALHKKKIIGYLMVTRPYGGVGFCNFMAVSKEHQKKGIGTTLLKSWERDAKTKGIHKLRLWSDKRNIDFYKHRGFKLIGRIPSHYFGTDDYLFYKIVQKPLEKNYLKR